MRRCHQVNHSNRCAAGMGIGVHYLRKPPRCSIVCAVVTGVLHFLFLSGGYLGLLGGGVPLPCRKPILVCFEFPFQFNELRRVMIYSSSLSESFIQCGEMKYQRHPGSRLRSLTIYALFFLICFFTILLPWAYIFTDFKF